MPVYDAINAEGETVPKYRRPNGVEVDCDKLVAARRRYVQQQEEMLQFGKQFPSEGRFFKTEAKQRLRLVKACTLWLTERAWSFPTELGSELDLIAFEAER